MKKIIFALLALCQVAAQAQVAGKIGNGINQKIRVGSIITSAPVTEPTADILWLKFNDGSGQLVTADVGPNAVIANAGGSWTTGADSVALHAYDAQGDADAYTGTSGSPANVTYGANVITVCFWAYNTAWGTGATPINLGTNLGTTYQLDKVGYIRGTDGAWDVGAYEYQEGTTPPASTNLARLFSFPRNLRIGGAR